jgi:hypothetical protein
MDETKTANSSTVLLLFDGPVQDIQARWNRAVAILKNEKIAYPANLRSNIRGHIQTEPKCVMCKVEMGDVQADLSFELPAAITAWLKPKEETDQIYKNLLRITELMAPSHIWWLPAGIVTTCTYFTENLAAYLFAGDAFPVLACVNFKKTDKGIISSHGLKWFCGQELECHSGRLPAKESMRRIARLAHHMVTQGPILLDRCIDGLEDGEQYRLSVDPDQPKVIMTQIGSAVPSIFH